MGNAPRTSIGVTDRSHSLSPRTSFQTMELMQRRWWEKKSATAYAILLSPRMEPLKHDTKFDCSRFCRKYWLNSCANPRDKVKGPLGLARGVKKGDISIRYEQALEILYLGVLRFRQRSFGNDWVKTAHLSQPLPRAFGTKPHKVRQGHGEEGIFTYRTATVFSYPTRQLSTLGLSLSEYFT